MYAICDSDEIGVDDENCDMQCVEQHKRTLYYSPYPLLMEI
jgi:hypothetical protein